MRTLLRWKARFLLAAVFVWDGVDAVRHPEDHVERFRKMEPTLEKIGLPPMLTSDAKLLSRVAGTLTAVAATGLAVGKYPRLCAAALALGNIPITVVNNPVWALSDKAARDTALRGILVGASLAGGLGMAVLDNQDRPTRKMRRQILSTSAASGLRK